MGERVELHLSEDNWTREPLAARLAEILMEEGVITRVDARGIAVDKEGNYTEGEWDDRLEKYVPNKAESTEDTGEVKPTSGKTGTSRGTTKTVAS